MVFYSSSILCTYITDGSKIKLKGKGFPVYQKEGQFGELQVTYTVKIPTNLTEKQKALFTELSKT